MGHSYYELYIHLVWTTKNKEPMITKELEESIHMIIRDKCSKFKIELIAVGNTEDHIHIFVSIAPNTIISEFIKECKGSTSHFDNFEMNNNLFWQNGYGALSVSKSGINIVKSYVENQKNHHDTNKGIIKILEKNGDDI